MKRYHIIVITGGTAYSGTQSFTIEAEGVMSNSNNYQFFNGEDNDFGLGNFETVAYFPINRTIITKIETL